MDCELCGSAGGNITAKIEGVQMNVCRNCASHGSVVSRPSEPRKYAPKRSFVPREKPELVESIHPNISQVLKQHREKLGLTHEQFASKMNLKASVYQHFESGSRQPSIETARKLEREVGVPLVVHIKVGKGSFGKTESEELTLGDFIKKR